MFDTQSFVEACKSAAPNGRKAIRDIVEEAVSDPQAIIDALGEPAEAGVQKLYCSDDLTIMNVIWAPHMTVTPHEHRMWAVIGVYRGAEDNIFWRRLDDGAEAAGVEAAGAMALRDGDVVALGPDVVHSVTNPTDAMTGAIHVYGGDFFGTPRVDWDPQTLAEREWDIERTLKAFADANRRNELFKQDSGSS